MRWGMDPRCREKNMSTYSKAERAFVASLFPFLSNDKHLAIYKLFEVQDFDCDDDGNRTFDDAFLAPIRDLTLDDLAEIFGEVITMNVPGKVRRALNGDEGCSGGYDVVLNGEELTWSDAYGGRECHTFHFTTKKWTSRRLENRAGRTCAACREICEWCRCSAHLPNNRRE